LAAVEQKVKEQAAAARATQAAQAAAASSARPLPPALVNVTQAREAAAAAAAAGGGGGAPNPYHARAAGPAYDGLPLELDGVDPPPEDEDADFLGAFSG
jgi:hypothetical protein